MTVILGRRKQIQDGFSEKDAKLNKMEEVITRLKNVNSQRKNESEIIKIRDSVKEELITHREDLLREIDRKEVILEDKIGKKVAGVQSEIRNELSETKQREPALRREV